jgi:hypothetical protein
MEVKIWPEIQNEDSGVGRWKQHQTPEEYRTGQYYNNLYLTRQGEIMQNKETWDRLIELCACQRAAVDDDDDYPNNFIALITPCVEGQVASIIEGDIEFTHRTDNPAHTGYMTQYDAASEYARRKNHFIEHFKDYTRQYDLLGNSCITPSWETGFSKVKGKPAGFPRLTVCPLLSVLVDGRIKDVKDLQYAEYIIHEIGFQTLSWARREYGDEKADALCRGYNRYDGENPDQSYDDQFSFTLLHIWTRNNEQNNLQLIEMDSQGFVLRISDPSKPYYKYVDNEYPFFFSRMVPVVGQFYGYGDGVILKGQQETLNNLMDEVELAARFSAQSKIIVDPRAKMGLEQLTSNPADIATCLNPRENIMVLTPTGLNPIVIQMIQAIRSMAPETTRFAPIMTGNQSGVSATATQINSQMMQGQVGINDKKSDIARAMEWVDRYCLKLCMEYWDKPFWSTLGYNYTNNATFVDPKDMLKAPSAVPVTTATMEKTQKKPGFLTRMFGKSRVKNDLARDSAGELIYTDIDFDTKVYIGRGIARGKTDMYNILQGLAGTVLRNAQGQPIGVITPERWIELMEETLGMKLRTESEEQPDLSQTSFDQSALTGMNPIGNNNVIQKPQQTPEGLMQNVPQQPSGDSRKTVI